MKVNPKQKMPFYWLIKRIFPEIMQEKCFAVFGNKHYADQEMPWYLIAHEETHVRQQRNYLGGMIWWFRYSLSKKFRYKQELEAYRNQYKMARKQVKDKNQRSIFLNNMATDLSSKQYGNIVSLLEARKQIKAQW